MKLAILICLFPLVAYVALASNGPADGPRVCVTYLKNGWKFPWHVRLNDTVFEFKKSLEAQYYGGQIPASKLTLIFEGNMLDNNQTLKHIGITKHSDIGLMHPPLDGRHRPKKALVPSDVKLPNYRGPKPAKLLIALVGTLEFTVEVDLTDTIKTVKTKIFQQEEYPVEQQHLTFGLELEDSQTLESYGIGDDFTVHLSVPLTWCYNW